MANIAVSYDEFCPDDTTGFGKRQDLLYRHGSSSDFDILVEPHHTKEDVEKAKEELRKEYNAEVINIVKLIEP
jgi:hypothetical protein